MINTTGAALTSLDVSYLGSVNDITVAEQRSPGWAVSVNGSAPIAALAYSTAGNLNTTQAATVTGFPTIEAGAEFSITWTTDRGLSTGAAKQIGLGDVVIGTVPVGNTYASWATTNAGDQVSTLDFDNDGVANGVEYFFGATGSTFTPNPQPNAAGLISFPHPAATPGATYLVKTSPDLVTWTAVTTSESGGFVNYTIPAGQGKIFVRLEVVVTP